MRAGIRSYNKNNLPNELEVLRFLFDVKLYNKTEKGDSNSGYKVFKITNIFFNPEKLKSLNALPMIFYVQSPKVKNNKKTLNVIVDVINQKIAFESDYFYDNRLDFFLDVVQGNTYLGSRIKESPQFQIELDAQKRRYPEYFL